MVIYAVSVPNRASAGFFSDLVTKVIGSDTQTASASDSTSDTTTQNSQNVPLAESSSINPDLSNVQNTTTDIIDQDEALISNNTLGPAKDLEKYASSAEINVYKVKKGDTLKSIAKQFKVTEDTILYSNSDIKKSDLLKIGQSLVILPVKAGTDKLAKADKIAVDSKIDKKATVIAKKKDKVVQDTTPTDDSSDNVADNIPDQVALPPTPAPVVANPVIVDNNKPAQVPDNTPVSTPEVNEKPVGTISGGYIWPFPDGIGRVSQGLHADQAYDFAAPIGTPIYAVQSGTVLVAHPTGYNGGYGKYVVINFDDGRQAIFGHMSKVVASSGDVVKQGDVIGYVGTTGHSTGPHVHIGFHGSLGNPYIGLKVNSTDLMIND